MKRKILLVGPNPPPSGGVSIHVSRLSVKINNSIDFECAVFDVGKLNFYDQKDRKKNLFVALLYFYSTSIVHLHISHPRKYFIAKVAKLLGKKIVYTQHNVRDENSNATLSLHKIADASIKVYKRKNEICDRVTKIIPAFIPSVSIEKNEVKVAQLFSKFETVVLAISTHPKDLQVKVEGMDIYGFDLLLKAYPEFYQKGQVLVLVDSNATMKVDYQEKIDALNRNGFSVIYLTSEVDFNALLKNVSVYVRPTRSDGDSLAIREALNSGVKVLASDCVDRPLGTQLFNSGDKISLVKQMKIVVEMPKPAPIPQPDFSIDVIEVYRSLYVSG